MFKKIKNYFHHKREYTMVKVAAKFLTDHNEALTLGCCQYLRECDPGGKVYDILCNDGQVTINVRPWKELKKYVC